MALFLEYAFLFMEKVTYQMCLHESFSKNQVLTILFRQTWLNTFQKPTRTLCLIKDALEFQVQNHQIQIRHILWK